MGHKFTYWNPETKPAFDIFDETRPDIFILTGPAQWRAVFKIMKARDGLRVVDRSVERPAAFDIVHYGQAKYEARLACDVAFVGNYNPDRFHDWIKPLSEHCNMKVFGEVAWPMPEYLGSVCDDLIPNIYASAKVCINVATGLERLYQFMGMGKPCVTNTYFPNMPVVKALDAKQFIDATLLMIDKPPIIHIKRGREIVRRGHTYFHRVAEMWREVGNEKESERTMGVYVDSYFN